MNNLRQNIDIKNSLQTTVFITPQMKQSLALLQMPIQELANEIASILEENPILETIDQDSAPETSEPDEYPSDGESLGESDSEDRTTAMAEIVSSGDWDEYIGYEKGDDISYKPMNDDEGIDYEQFIGSVDSLCDHLLRQLKICALSQEEYKTGEYIIGSLGEDGYYRADKDDACEELGITLDVFEKVLTVIKTFDPSGIAAESLQECIITQLYDIGAEQVYITFAIEIFEKYSAELASFKYDDILRKMCIERDTFDYIMELIKKTDPRPGLNFSGSETKNITPDIFIIPNGENFDIILNESGLPAVRLNTYYTHMLKNQTLDEDSKQYIKEKIKNAVWVIESLQKRQKAIYKVAKALTEFQTAFLREGEAKLKPLKLKEIAESTGLHESTISRVTSGKYAMTARGMIELKAFFSKSLGSDDGDMSVSLVKTKIKELIDAENPEEPLSDQRIVELMEIKGIKIARRTVAKYRDEMNILTMSQRKRLRG